MYKYDATVVSKIRNCVYIKQGIIVSNLVLVILAKINLKLFNPSNNGRLDEGGRTLPFRVSGNNSRITVGIHSNLPEKCVHVCTCVYE